ncbi:hypothetical protein Rctr197k_268 [Virus Rctr197k]|nr:hypothetical protein Rctr197k_268 [Virus Rctr197k]
MDKTEWQQIHELKGTEGVTLRIQRRGDTRPQYSYQVGRERRPDLDGFQDNRLMPFVPVFVQGQGTTVTIDRQSEALVKQALDWIQADAAAFEANARGMNGDASRKKRHRE